MLLIVAVNIRDTYVLLITAIAESLFELCCELKGLFLQLNGQETLHWNNLIEVKYTTRIIFVNFTQRNSSFHRVSLLYVRTKLLEN